MTASDLTTDSTPHVLSQVRTAFGDRFVAGRMLAEQAAVALLDSRAGRLDRDEATRLGQLFNTHELAGRIRQDRFSPAFAGATMQKVTEDLDRFNDVVATLWTADVDTALDTLGGILGDRSVLPGAGSSLPSMLLYLRDPDQFGVCINATMRGLAAAMRCPPFHADSRAEYERFCRSLNEWRTRHDVAPQEADAVLTALWREARQARADTGATTTFGQAPLAFLADLANHNDGAWMQANRDRYRTELRQPFVTLLEQLAERHLRELDPQLDTAVKTNHVLASIRKRFPDEQGEYYTYLWGAFSRGRKQEDVQLAVLVQPAALEASLFLGSATDEQRERLRTALTNRADELFASVAPHLDELTWEIHVREHPLDEAVPGRAVGDAAGMQNWLDAGGTSIKWAIPAGDPRLDDPHLADQIGTLFRALHPLAAAAWGDDVVVPVEDDEEDDGGGDPGGPLSVGDVAEACHLPAEVIDEWVGALTTLRQGLFYGPPGTGKTHVATTLARHLATSAEHIELVQFHSAYSYEDFIEGLRPDATADSGALRYTVRPGLFQELCTKARAAADDTFVLVIDEMNRADVAAVFGELLLLLEYRGSRSVLLPYSQRRFSVPRNLVVLGTMNTADRSLALVDFALRRRFNAFPLHPSRDVLARWATTHPDVDGDLLVGLFDLVLDRVGADSPVAPGHSYWMVDDADAVTAERIWSYQVRPYLAEHWFEQPEQLARLDQDVRALIAERS
ncbi:DUF2461 family protein [Geodermatophilus sp. SYSU D01105]